MCNRINNPKKRARLLAPAADEPWNSQHLPRTWLSDTLIPHMRCDSEIEQHTRRGWGWGDWWRHDSHKRECARVLKQTDQEKDRNGRAWEVRTLKESEKRGRSRRIGGTVGPCCGEWGSVSFGGGGTSGFLRLASDDERRHLVHTGAGAAESAGQLERLGEPQHSSGGHALFGCSTGRLRKKADAEREEGGRG
eukprot:52998-Rhodomonas_salina.1